MAGKETDIYQGRWNISTRVISGTIITGQANVWAYLPNMFLLDMKLEFKVTNYAKWRKA